MSTTSRPSRAKPPERVMAPLAGTEVRLGALEDPLAMASATTSVAPSADTAKDACTGEPGGKSPVS